MIFIVILMQAKKQRIPFGLYRGTVGIRISLKTTESRRRWERFWPETAHTGLRIFCTPRAAGSMRSIYSLVSFPSALWLQAVLVS